MIFFYLEIVYFPSLHADSHCSASYGVHILQLICFPRVSSNVSVFNNRNQFVTTKLLKQGYQYYKRNHKAISKFYNSYSDLELIVDLKTLLQQGISQSYFRLISFINSK